FGSPSPRPSAWKPSSCCVKSSMATIQLPPDFKEFLRLLNSNDVEYLIIDGNAVNYHGYSRATADLDVWIAVDATNADRVARVLREFGFPETEASTFLQP